MSWLSPEKTGKFWGGVTLFSLGFFIPMNLSGLKESVILMNNTSVLALVLGGAAAFQATRAELREKRHYDKEGKDEHGQCCRCNPRS